ncbi:hypothetical protein ZORO111902_07515 [Zobellia roscoffensis]
MERYKKGSNFLTRRKLYHLGTTFSVADNLLAKRKKYIGYFLEYDVKKYKFLKVVERSA